MNINTLWVYNLPYFLSSVYPGVISVCITTCILIAIIIASKTMVAKGNKRGTESMLNGEQLIGWLANVDKDFTANLEIRKKGQCEYINSTNTIIITKDVLETSSVTSEAFITMMYGEVLLAKDDKTSLVFGVKQYINRFYKGILKIILILAIFGTILQLWAGMYGTILFGIAGIIFPLSLLALFPALIAGKKLSRNSCENLIQSGAQCENETRLMSRIILMEYIRRCIL